MREEKEDFLGSLFGNVHITPEQMEEKRKADYELSKVNLENMSFWLPKIQDSTTKIDSVLQVPVTKIVQLGYEEWVWLRSDNYTDEQLKGFGDRLARSIEGFLDGKKLFMKTGIFSDKFCFFKTIVDEERQRIGNHFLDMYYNSMLVGAHNTSEVVFREFLESKVNVPMIYMGMPLHTEFRVFYDFDKGKAVGVSNYWHPEVMEKGLYNEKDSSNYRIAKDKIVTEYNELKMIVVAEVEKFMKGCDGLQGAWSVDVMKNGDDYWLIDMARMERSALLDVMEEIEAD